MPAAGVEHQLGNRKGRNLVGAFVEQPLDLGFDLVQAADTGPKNHAAAVGVFRGKIEARILDGVDTRNERELREAIDPLGVFGGDVVARSPVVEITTELHLMGSRIE